MLSNVTIFGSIKDTSAPFHRSVFKILERIKEGKSKETVKRIRSCKSKTERNELKQLLPQL